MTKSDLAKEISRKSTKGVTPAIAEEVINLFMNVVKDEVIDGGSVQLVGLGTFTSAKRDARECRNPSNGQKMMVAAKRVPKFIPGSAFKDALKK